MKILLVNTKLVLLRWYNGVSNVPKEIVMFLYVLCIICASRFVFMTLQARYNILTFTFHGNAALYVFIDIPCT